MKNTYVEDTKAILKRPWIVFIILVLISLTLCGIYANEKEDGVLHRIQNSCTSIVMPLSFVGNSLNKGLVSVYDYIDNSTADENTLTGLKAENAKLKAQLSQNEKYKKEAERLEKLLQLKNNYKIEGICAKVIGRSSSAWNQTITVGCGTDDGISEGQTVIGTCGVVGQVISAGPSTCVVRKISDPNSGVAVKIQNSQSDCILKGSLDGVLHIDDIDANTSVTVGESVVTSGLGGSYIDGLPVGDVYQILQNQSGSGRKIVVKPLDQSDALDEVIIVKSIMDASQEDTNQDNKD